MRSNAAKIGVGEQFSQQLGVVTAQSGGLQTFVAEGS